MAQEAQEVRTLASHPTGHAVLPKHSMSIHKPEKSVLPLKYEVVLSLASPAQPRFKADRLRRSIFGRWLFLRQG